VQYVAEHRHPLNEIEALENHPDFPAKGAHLPRSGSRRFQPSEADAPLRRIDKPVDAAEQRAFARAARTYYDYEFSAPDVEADVP
jgi:hypothetical protein